eukprot:TRINITY_DN4868_c0_g2_i1.p1 TRINITY_DN4868_c0_g2~~TRINITY_DN4868_c0_g2_i1.p1  ORF type:complete len:290 (-),score=37.34 TRINITY_DN4868_c0_g2_i1:21-869(-)
MSTKQPSSSPHRASSGKFQKTPPQRASGPRENSVEDLDNLLRNPNDSPRRSPYSSKKPQVRNQQRTPGRSAKGAASNEELVGILNDVEKKVQSLDITEGSQGICFFCSRPILREVVDVDALGRKYHKEHFLCFLCKQIANPKKYYEKDGEIYCTHCFEKSILPPCARCGSPIVEECITALDSKWHPECFVCKACNGGFPTGEFFDKNGEPYCKADYLRLFSQKCKMCSRPIDGECLQALGSNWHPTCFHCPSCKKPFGPGFYQHDGFAYCEEHYLHVKGIRR